MTRGREYEPLSVEEREALLASTKALKRSDLEALDHGDTIYYNSYCQDCKARGRKRFVRVDSTNISVFQGRERKNFLNKRIMADSFCPDCFAEREKQIGLLPGGSQLENKKGRKRRKRSGDAIDAVCKQLVIDFGLRDPSSGSDSGRTPAAVLKSMLGGRMKARDASKNRALEILRSKANGSRGKSIRARLRSIGLNDIDELE